MTQNQQTTLSAIRAGVAARNIKVNEQVWEDGGKVFVWFGPGWPTVRIGKAGGIDLLEIRTYRVTPLEAAIHGDQLYAKQQALDSACPDRAAKHKTGKPLISSVAKVKSCDPVLPARSTVDRLVGRRLANVEGDSEPKATTQGSDLDLFMRHIEATIDLTEAAKGPPSYWTSLPLCVIDSVWSIQSKYEKQVVPLVKRFCRSHSPHWEGETSSKPTGDVGPTLREFVDILEHRLENGYTYKTLFGNSQRTSSKSGILKSEAVHRFAKALLASGINNFSDLRDRRKLEDAEKRVKQIPGQGRGITFKYLLMLSGEDNYVKPDTHIRRYVSDALSLDWSRLVSEKRAEELVREAATKFAKDYPGLTPAGLDYAIWNYQNKRNRPSPRPA